MNKKIVINKKFGGFELSDVAYEHLIKYGIPVRGYKNEVRGDDGLFIKIPENEGKIIFDRTLEDDSNSMTSIGLKNILFASLPWQVIAQEAASFGYDPRPIEKNLRIKGHLK